MPTRRRPDRREQSLHDVRPEIEDPDNFPWDEKKRGADSVGPRVSSYFGDVKNPLIDFIRGSGAVVGCVAWLTDLDILDELATVDCAIIVQKEDFLRPDVDAKDAWKDRLRQRYSRVKNSWGRWLFPAPLNGMTTLGDHEIAGVRCVGNHNAERKAASPRMHHKFLVRLRQEKVAQNWGELGVSESVVLHPEAVWTGSFNFTKNAGDSFENALVVHDEAIARSYLEEFSRVASLGEPLDWESDWVMPQWRVGT